MVLNWIIIRFITTVLLPTSLFVGVPVFKIYSVNSRIIKMFGKKNNGITFEVPRYSLMKAINLHIFDDLLIGNFMKTTLHNMRSLYEVDFNFYLAKYADNGRAETFDELEQYFKIYRKRIGFERIYESVMDNSANIAKRILPANRNNKLFMTSKKMINKYYSDLIKMGEIEHEPYETILHSIYDKENCFSPIPSLALHCTNVNSVFGLSPNINANKTAINIDNK